MRSALEKITLSNMIEQRSGRIPRALYDLLLNPQSLFQSSNLGLKTGNARALGQKVIARMLNSTASRQNRRPICYQNSTWSDPAERRIATNPASGDGIA
ncbi:TPA: hypothetical protein ACJ3E0_006112 [Pseudomonas aeruginosa]